MLLDPVGMLDKNNKKKYVKLLTIQKYKVLKFIMTTFQKIFTYEWMNWL
jgi:hypothetical protein